MNLISATVAAIAGVLTVASGEFGLGMLWIVVASILGQLWLLEKRL